MGYSNQIISRGDVYFASFPYATGSEILGTHPVVIVQNDVGNYHSGTVIGIVLTSNNQKRPMPTHVLLDEPSCMCNGSVAMAEQIYTIDRRRLRDYAGHLGAATMARINQAIHRSLGLSRAEPALMCLCPGCLKTFRDMPHHSVRRVDWNQQAKDACTYCGSEMGYDYWVRDWSAPDQPTGG